MQKIGFLHIIFFFFTTSGLSQNCDLIKLEKELIQHINTGTFKEGQQKAERWPACANTPLEAYRGYVYQFQLYRNDRRYKHAYQAAHKADSLFYLVEKNNWPFPDHHLMLAEAGAVRKKFAEAKQALDVFTEKNKEQNARSSDLAHATFIRAFIAQHGDKNYEAAQQLYRDALRQLLEVATKPFYHIGQTLRYLGATNRVHGDFEQSLYYYEQELANYQKSYTADHREIANTHYNIGAVLYELLRYEEALSHFLITHDSWKKFRTPDDRFMRYLNEAIGDMYWELGNREKTLEFYDLSAAGEKPVNNDQAFALLERGGALIGSGQQASAMRYFQQALDWRRSMYGEQHAMTGACQNFIGKKLFEAGHYDEAIMAYQQTIRMLVPGMADTAFLANPDPALPPVSEHDLMEALASKGIALAERQKSSNSEDDAHLAFTTLQLAVHWMEQIRRRPISDEIKAFWSGKHQRVFEELIGMAEQLYLLKKEDRYLAAAFTASEKSKAFLLLSALQSQRADAFAGVPDSVVAREQNLQKNILEYEGKISLETQRCSDARERHLELWQQKLLSQKSAYDALVKMIEQQFPAYHSLKYEVENASVEKVQKQLLANGRSALLAFFDGQKKWFAFLVTKHGLQLFSIKKETEDDQQLGRFLSNLSSPVYFLKQPDQAFDLFTRDAFSLYEKLLKQPLSHCPETVEHLYIIPDGQLYFLPFACLLVRPPEEMKRQYRTLPYLLHEFSTSYSQSATLLCQETKQARKSQHYTAFAPDYELTIYEKQPVEIHPLFSNQKEASAGSAIFGGRAYLGTAATENAFKALAHKSAILHLPLHTLIDHENPMLSRLLFSPDDQEDGILYSFELYNLHLPTELAILSACNSGTGLLHTGEGMMSLERGFQYAGCPSLLTTLWTVDDAASSSLSLSFLENIKNETTKDAALAEAQKRYLAEADPAMSHPFFWAGFRMVGDVSPVAIKNLPHSAILWGLGVLFLIGFFWKIGLLRIK
ncbi:MAG: CHAT domain-containing tetratricopeptide repeat protein [Bacteroidota bacterium]